LCAAGFCRHAALYPTAISEWPSSLIISELSDVIELSDIPASITFLLDSVIGKINNYQIRTLMTVVSIMIMTMLSKMIKAIKIMSIIVHTVRGGGGEACGATKLLRRGMLVAEWKTITDRADCCDGVVLDTKVWLCDKYTFGFFVLQYLCN
jgi:hypothetical protein